MTSGQFLRCHQLDEKPATCNQDVPNIFGQLSDAQHELDRLERVDAKTRASWSTRGRTGSATHTG